MKMTPPRNEELVAPLIAVVLLFHRFHETFVGKVSCPRSQVR